MFTGLGRRLNGVVFAVILAVSTGPNSSSALGEGTALYGSDVHNNYLVTIDRSSAVAMDIGSFSVDGSMTGLAHDPLHNILYGITNHDRFHRIDPATGQATEISSGMGIGNANGLAYDSVHQVLYATDCSWGDSTLYTVDVSTGAATAIALITGASSVEGLAYDSQTDTLFGVADYDGTIVTIDRDTGTAMALPSALPGDHMWGGLTFDPGLSVLFATEYVQEGLYQVDPITGIATLVGQVSSSHEIGVQGLALVPEPATLSLLALGGLTLIRRRRK